MIEFRPLEADDIEVRVAQCTEKGAQLLLYKTARCDMRILDETVGQENWDCSYECINDRLFCTVGIKCDGGWVYKQDVGVESNMEPAKGEASDAFKRACFKWGIGRELYTSPFVWVGKDRLKSHRSKGNGKWACYDRFYVKRIKVEDGRITVLEIANDGGETVYPVKPGSKPKHPKKPAGKPAEPSMDGLRELYRKALDAGIKKEGIESWRETYLGPYDGMDVGDIAQFEAYLEGLLRDIGDV